MALQSEIPAIWKRIIDLSLTPIHEDPRDDCDHQRDDVWLMIS